MYTCEVVKGPLNQYVVSLYCNICLSIFFFLLPFSHTMKLHALDMNVFVPNENAKIKKKVSCKIVGSKQTCMNK
jgi:hypothetical protein